MRPVRPKKDKDASVRSSGGTIPYALYRSSRRRTMEIRVTDELEVRVVAPRHTPEKEIRSFILEKARWISLRMEEARQVRETLARRMYDPGCEFLFLGKKYPLRITQGLHRRARLDFDGSGWHALVPAGLDTDRRRAEIKDRLIAWYREQAGEVFGGRIFHFARRMNLEPNKIVVKSQKKLWGSCLCQEKAIHLNWQLIMTPLEVVDYVVVHELSHLLVPNHSARFWRIVRRVLPDYLSRQKWLKIHAVDMLLP